MAILGFSLFLSSTAALAKNLGASCRANSECNSGYCDAGDGTSKTATCVPQPGRGNPGDYCTHPNHCRSARCDGLHASGGRWIAGKCGGQRDLGGSCNYNQECKSGFCDAGNNTSHTNTCVPQVGRGNQGDYCTHPNHCRSAKCDGLRSSGGRWIGGQCGGQKDLGGSCSNNQECKSGLCDAGNNTSHTNTCVPLARTGSMGAYCTHPNHCVSGFCDGLRASGGKWIPGKCGTGAITAVGAVMNTAGAVVPGVTVKLWDVNPGVNTNVLLGSTTTDRNGAFNIRGRPYQDPGDALGGGRQPDIRITVETTALYSVPKTIDHYFSGVITEAPAAYSNPQNYWTLPTNDPAVRSLGKSVTIAVWPDSPQTANSLPNRDFGSTIQVPRGAIRVPTNRWEKVRTRFDPRKHGYSFRNADRQVCWGPTCAAPWNKLFSTTQALCGGFSLTALKHYINRRCDTNVAYKPLSNGKLPEALKKQLVENQMETFFFRIYQDAGFDLTKGININAVKFLEWQAKQDEPNQQWGHTIGYSTKAEWAEVKKQLRDRRLPVVIGQINAKAAPLNYLDIDLVTKNHQVLAIGYDYNPFFGSVTLFVYDPNYVGQVRQMRFNEDLVHSKMFIDYDDRQGIRGFFLNVAAPDGKTAPPPCP